ncbi:MAG: hypothetical protein A3D74_03055 [Candidatus Levybacteria bacterium RIFCSPHIGHO2_02_FULL_37_13]|nr:MAG: hypothetical protein A3D74_03055 [Candidatus Levybacteria bacterium RIFCSPHIGHO2_02_FULL_37_13]OGH30624.1 MAG: hypothetical protein A3E40_00235 [Candidatus Levybacteria bacterium RIFCSPHIGHO2_12_FULL_37_9]OGH39692.1 MAG: hypothetical protein A3B41_00510 [Candidatus Levybacteria bacterium RIFCSPLOWO2_01_FULL_37_26]
MNILIVEDDVFFQKFYSQKLLEAGFTVNVATDGDDAIVKAIKTKPDLIILDIIMPRKDGFEVLEDISKDKVLSKIPILVFSTLGQDNDVQRALKLGAVGYVNKTFFDFGNLKAKIDAAIAAKKA